MLRWRIQPEVFAHQALHLLECLLQGSTLVLHLADALTECLIFRDNLFEAYESLLICFLLVFDHRLVNLTSHILLRSRFSLRCLYDLWQLLLVILGLHLRNLGNVLLATAFVGGINGVVEA